MSRSSTQAPAAPKPSGDIIDRGLQNFEGQRPGLLRAGWYYNTGKNVYFYATGLPVVRSVAPLWENTIEAVLSKTPLKSSAEAPEGGEKKAVANLDKKVAGTLGSVDDFIDQKKDQGIGLIKQTKDTALDLAFHPTKIPGAAVNGVKGAAGYTYNTTTGVVAGTYNYTTSTIGSIFSTVTGYGAQAKDKASEVAVSAKDTAAGVLNDPKGAADRAAETVRATADRTVENVKATTAAAKRQAANAAHKAEANYEHAAQQTRNKVNTAE